MAAGAAAIAVGFLYSCSKLDKYQRQYEEMDRLQSPDPEKFSLFEYKQTGARIEMKRLTVMPEKSGASVSFSSRS